MPRKTGEHTVPAAGEGTLRQQDFFAMFDQAVAHTPLPEVKAFSYEAQSTPLEPISDQELTQVIADPLPAASDRPIPRQHVAGATISRRPWQPSGHRPHEESWTDKL